MNAIHTHSTRHSSPTVRGQVLAFDPPSTWTASIPVLNTKALQDPCHQLVVSPHPHPLPADSCAALGVPLSGSIIGVGGVQATGCTGAATLSPEVAALAAEVRGGQVLQGLRTCTDTLRAELLWLRGVIQCLSILHRYSVSRRFMAKDSASVEINMHTDTVLAQDVWS